MAPRWGEPPRLRTVCCPPTARDESGQTDSSPPSHLCTASLSPTFTSNIPQLSPPPPALLISWYSSESASPSKKLPALMVSPHKTNRLRRGRKKKQENKKKEQPTGQSWAAATRCPAGGDPWPFAPAAFSWAAESVRWPHLLNVERPLTGSPADRGSIWRETEWEVAEYDAHLFH